MRNVVFTGDTGRRVGLNADTVRYWQEQADPTTTLVTFEVNNEVLVRATFDEVSQALWPPYRGDLAPGRP